MPDIRSVRTYGNPVESPGQPAPAKEPGRFPNEDRIPQPGHSWANQFVGYEPSQETIVRDRHAILNRGSERFGRMSEDGAGGAGPDPMKDGPARPSLRLINRTFNAFYGNHSTANQDDLSRGYRTVSTGQWAGQQDGAVTQIWGGTPGLYTPYGSYAGYTQADVKGIQSPVDPGSPGDGPQMIPSQPAHGLHSNSMQNMWPIISRYNVTAQQRPGRVDRPANSPIAGQSFSQTVLGQNQLANRAQNRPESPKAGLTPGTPGSNWRGA